MEVNYENMKTLEEYRDRLEAEIERLRGVVDAMAEDSRSIRTVLRAYAEDENRYNRGDGEPFGSIDTETRMLARAYTNYEPFPRRREYGPTKTKRHSTREAVDI